MKFKLCFNNEFYPFVLGQASKPNRRPIINAIPDKIDKIQRINARLLNLCASVINPHRNLSCALRAKANANKPRKDLLKENIQLLD